MKTLIATAALALCACASSPPPAPLPPCERVPLTRVQAAELRGPDGWAALLAMRSAELADAERKHCWIGPPR